MSITITPPTDEPAFDLEMNGAPGDQGLPEQTRPTSKPTLLVVDDEEGPRLSLKVIFSDEFKILLAEDGPTAIELARNNKIDVAVLDIRMAGMSGIEVLERLRYLDPDIEAVMRCPRSPASTARRSPSRP